MTEATPIAKPVIDPIVDTTEVQRDLAIIGSDLDSFFRTQANLFSHYAEKLFRAEMQLDRLKMTLDIKVSVTDKTIRDRIIAENSKITEAAITQEIIRTPVIIAHKLAYNEADGIVNLIKNLLEALKQRRDMLVQLGAASREELKGEMRMRTSQVFGREPLSTDELKAMVAQRMEKVG